MTTQTITVPFHDQSLTAALIDGIAHVAMKPICENIGLDWFSQMKRIKRNPILNEGKVIMTSPSNGGIQEMLMLPIKYLNGWLFGVDASRVKPEIKERLLEYQRECFDVLANHFMPQQTPPTWKSPITRKPKANDKPLPKTVLQAIARHANTLSRRHYEDYHVVLQRMARWMMDVYDLKGEDLIEALQQEDLGWVGYPDKPAAKPASRESFGFNLPALTGSTQRRWLVVQRPGDAVSLQPIYPDQQVMSLDEACGQIAKDSEALKQLVAQMPADKLAVMLDAVTRQAAVRLRLCY